MEEVKLKKFHYQPSNRREERENNDARQYVIYLLNHGYTHDELHDIMLLEYDVDSYLTMIQAGILKPHSGGDLGIDAIWKQ